MYLKRSPKYLSIFCLQPIGFLCWKEYPMLCSKMEMVMTNTYTFNEPRDGGAMKTADNSPAYATPQGLIHTICALLRVTTEGKRGR